MVTAEQRAEREKRFYRWISAKSIIPGFDLMGFRSTRHGYDQANDILMKRPEGLQTVSITQINHSMSSPAMIDEIIRFVSTLETNPNR